MNHNTTTDLMPRSTVTELCNAWRQSKEDIEKGFALLDTAEKRLQHFFEGQSCLSIQSSNYVARFDDPRPNLEYLERQVWAAIVQRVEIRKILSLKKVKELDEMLSPDRRRYGNDLPTLPPLTYENVIAMLEQNLSQMGEHLKEKVLEVWEFLRPRTNGLVTNEVNLQAGLGKKVIKGWSVDRGYLNTNGWNINHNLVDEYRAVDQVFHMLDGKMANSASYRGGIGDAIATQTGMINGEFCDTFETEYFRGRCFKNHNLHLEFKRQDLIDKFNLICAGKNLRDAK